MSIAVITGASSGMGREFALQLKKMGEVDGFLLIARRADRLTDLAMELGDGAVVLPADLSSTAGLEAVERYFQERKPVIRYLINAAGFGKFGNYAQVPRKENARMIDVNVKATVLISHMAIPYMEAKGHIILLGSGSCFTPLPYFNVYAASKSFVLHYAKGLREEVKPLGIYVTCFCPGWVDTPFLAIAEEQKGVPYPKDPKPLLQNERVVAYALRRAQKGKFFAVTNWYTKLQHMLFKLLPDSLLTRTWLSSVLKIKK